MTGPDMRPPPHLTFGFHKVWNKRQGQNNQRGAQANKSVYSSSSTPTPRLCPSPVARPRRRSALGKGGRRMSGIAFCEPPGRRVTSGPWAYLKDGRCEGGEGPDSGEEMRGHNQLHILCVRVCVCSQLYYILSTNILVLLAKQDHVCEAPPFFFLGPTMSEDCVKVKPGFSG